MRRAGDAVSNADISYQVKSASEDQRLQGTGHADLGLSGLLLVVMLAVGASIGSPGTPGVGIVIFSMMLGTVGIPAEGIALIIGVDRILDMNRTTLNVAGDLVAASVIDQHTKALRPRQRRAATAQVLQLQVQADVRRPPGTTSTSLSAA